jgi:hypothetical protein
MAFIRLPGKTLRNRAIKPNGFYTPLTELFSHAFDPKFI